MTGDGPRAGRGPFVIREGEDGFDDEDAAASPLDAPPPPDPFEEPPTGAAGAGAIAVAGGAGAGSRLGRIFLWSAGTLLSFALSLAAYDFVEGLFARNLWLGRIGLGLAALATLAALGIALRELAGLIRLGRVETLRETARNARAGGARRAAEETAAGVARLYAGRADLAWSRDRVAAREADAIDADALLDLVEREYLEGLDARATAAAGEAARSVAAATALIPLAFVDVAAALAINLRMVRRIAEIYGGRAGWLGSWRLTRAVAAHLIATGAVAMSDDLVSAVIGGGAIARISRRFGEGVVNGALTARVGAAAIEVCRPMPFETLPKPSARAIATGALKGLVSKS